MLRSDVTAEQRFHKMFTRLRRQHARNPSLLPISAIAAFLIISLVLYLSSPASSAHHPATSTTTTLLHAATTPQQSTDDNTPPLSPAGIKPPTPPTPATPADTPLAPLTVRALAALRAQLDARIVVHDFEACIIIRRMMKHVGDDRESGWREGKGEADIDLNTYLTQLRQRVDDEDTRKTAEQQKTTNLFDEAPPTPLDQPAQPLTPTQQQQRIAALESEWTGEVAALQDKVKQLQAELEANHNNNAALPSGDSSNSVLNGSLDPIDGAGGGGGGSNERRRDRRIRFSKIQSRVNSDASQQHQSRSADALTDVVKSPEEIALDQINAQQHAGQQQQQQHQTHSVDAARPGDGNERQGEEGGGGGGDDDTGRVARVVSSAHDNDKREDGKEEEGELAWRRRKWKRRWDREKHHDKGEKGDGDKESDDDD